MDNTLEMTLTGIAHGGNAVGRQDGKAIFVSGGIPGERVRVRITADKGRFAVGEVVDVLQASPNRVTPRCAHFGACGGCHWQHMDYPTQLVLKQEIVTDVFKRIGAMADAPVLPIIASPSAWEYRSHITFHGAGGSGVGFIGQDDRTLVTVRECHLIPPSLLEAAQSVSGKAARVRAQAGTDGAVSVMTSEADEQRFRVQRGNKALQYTVLGRNFRASAGSFFQVNLPQAEQLVKLAVEDLGLQAHETALDLYAGVGLFTAFMAQQVSKVTWVEEYAPALDDARVNLRDFANVEFLAGSVEKVLPRLRGWADAVLLDPPRSGMDKAALEALLRLKPRRIAYVSCDPATLARDAKALVAGGYQLRSVQPVDMFPQTYHIESVSQFVQITL